MCGIAAIFTRKDQSPDMNRTLAAMRDAMPHRGPDDSGIWTDREGRAGLAHTRLSILDLSAAGHQPMSTPNERHHVVFNGEIYNFKALRADLECEGVEFRTHTDTEVLLRLYEKHGAACVEKLRGMFAFALWDAYTGVALLGRDPLGIKPLYHTTHSGTLACASELKALQAAQLLGGDMNPVALARYFETGSVPEPLTLLKGAALLPAGHTLVWKDGTLEKPRQYWRIKFGVEIADPGEAVRMTREALIDSVRHHFVSDVPVGIFLSGGIDSTALLALARIVGQENIDTFSIGVDDPTLDESSVAKRTAQHFGARHHEMKLNASCGKPLLERFLDAMDQPTIDGFNTFTVSSIAHDNGLKVVLSGLGGDEVFGGYPSFQKVPKLYNAVRAIGPLRHLAAPLLSRLGPSPQLRRLGDFLEQAPTIRGAYRTLRGIFSPAEARKLAAILSGTCASDISPVSDRLFTQPTAADQISELELSLYMRNQLLRDSDVMSMAHSLELRVPFADRVLIETVAAIHSSLRLQPGKRLLLDAVPEVPDWVANTPKRGFLFPYKQWIESDWKSTFDSALRDLPVRAETWYQQWSVFVLKHWRMRHSAL